MNFHEYFDERCEKDTFEARKKSKQDLFKQMVMQTDEVQALT